MRMRKERLEQAGEKAKEQLQKLYDKAVTEVGEARAADVKDISRLIRNLTGQEKIDFSSMEPSVIVAEDLSPSETVQIDKEKILAFATVHGSTNSHTAILARMMNIPALVSVPLDLEDIHTGMTAVVDIQSNRFFFRQSAADLCPAVRDDGVCGCSRRNGSSCRIDRSTGWSRYEAGGDQQFCIPSGSFWYSFARYGCDSFVCRIWLAVRQKNKERSAFHFGFRIRNAFCE